MKNASAVLTMILLLSSAAPALSAMKHEPTIEKGKMLFNDPKLGTNGKTCNDCHKDGAGMEKATDRKDLEGMVNGCIKSNLKGKALKPKSVEMQSLLLYIKSVGSVKKPAAKNDRVGC
jgi:cytochrome c peroxidase